MQEFSTAAETLRYPGPGIFWHQPDKEAKDNEKCHPQQSDRLLTAKLVLHGKTEIHEIAQNQQDDECLPQLPLVLLPSFVNSSLIHSDHPDEPVDFLLPIPAHWEFNSGFAVVTLQSETNTRYSLSVWYSGNGGFTLSHPPQHTLQEAPLTYRRTSYAAVQSWSLAFVHFEFILIRTFVLFAIEIRYVQNSKFHRFWHNFGYSTAAIESSVAESCNWLSPVVCSERFRRSTLSPQFA